MAKTDGFSSLVCDRCGSSDFAPDGSPTMQAWRTVKHIQADNSEVSRYLCPECVSKYRPLASSQDDEWSAFMAGDGE